MPLEIREIAIKMNVAPETQGAAAAATGGGGAGSSGGGGQDAIVKACVEKVLAILKEKNER